MKTTKNYYMLRACMVIIIMIAASILVGIIANAYHNKVKAEMGVRP